MMKTRARARSRKGPSALLQLERETALEAVRSAHEDSGRATLDKVYGHCPKGGECRLNRGQLSTTLQWLKSRGLIVWEPDAKAWRPVQ